jgi:hypothetical protein
MPDKYRFDDAYHKVYIYNEAKKAYVYECRYLSADILTRDNETIMVNKMDLYMSREQY